MKPHGHDTEEILPKTGVCIAPLCTQLSIDNGTWLEMEHTTSAPIIPLETCKRSLVSLHVSMEDFEHGCDLSRYCKNHPDQCMWHRDRKKGPEECSRQSNFAESSGDDIDGN